MQAPRRPRHSRINHRHIFGHGCDLDQVKQAFESGDIQWSQPPNMTATLSKGSWPLPSSGRRAKSELGSTEHLTDFAYTNLKKEGMTYKDLDKLLSQTGAEDLPEFDFERQMHKSKLRSYSTPPDAANATPLEYLHATDRYYQKRHIPLEPQFLHKTVKNDKPWPVEAPQATKGLACPGGNVSKAMCTNVGHPLTGHGLGKDTGKAYGSNIQRHASFQTF